MNNLNLIKKDIDKFEMKLNNKVYLVNNYFELSDKDRKILLKDFQYLIFLLKKFSSKTKKKWFERNHDIFIENFTYFWASIYITNKYISVIGSNRIIDTFLNDPYQGKKGILNDFRKNNFLLKHRNILIKTYFKAKKNPFTYEIIQKYPISIITELINYRKWFKYSFLKYWLPIQYFFAKLLVRRKWWWKKNYIIKNKHLDDLEPCLKPGDILLHRSNFYLHNVTMPGFWNHAMLYIGDKFIIESTPPKVRKINWRKAAIGDYICVLRPKCSDKIKYKAILYARSQIGKPYDFNFDFLSDEKVVCTELVLKAYPHLNPKLENHVGRLAYPSVNFIDLYNEKKLEFVYFLDSLRTSNKVILGTPQELSKTNLRTKWDLLQK